MAVGLIVGLLIGLPAYYFLLSESFDADRKIACSAVVSSATSNYYSGRSPVIAYYYPEEEYVPMPQSADLSLDVKNNNMLSLYDVAVEVTYENSDGGWSTAKSTIVFLERKETKRIIITLLNPALTTESLVRMSPSGFEANGTIGYVLSIDDLKIVAYGFASSR